jgi:uncharacterized protein
MSISDLPPDQPPTLPPNDAITYSPPVHRPRFSPPFENPNRPHPGFFWALVWCFLFLVVTQIPGAILAVAVFGILYTVAPQLFAPDALANTSILMASKGMSIALAVAFLWTEAMVIGFSCLILWLIVGRSWPRRIGLHRLPTGFQLFFVLAAFPAMVLLANVVYAVFKESLPHLGGKQGLPGMEEMVKVFSQWPWPFAVLVIGVGPGIGEGLWCRGFLGRGLVGQYGPFFGVLFTSFFFGLIHIDPCQGTMAMVMGLWLHFTYLMTRSLWVPMLLHFLNNSLAVVSPHIPGLDVLEPSLDQLPINVPITAVGLMALVAIALYQSRARLLEPDERFALAPSRIEHLPDGSTELVTTPRPSAFAIGAVVVGLAFFICALALMAMYGR